MARNHSASVRKIHQGIFKAKLVTNCPQRKGNTSSKTTFTRQTEKYSNESHQDVRVQVGNKSNTKSISVSTNHNISLVQTNMIINQQAAKVSTSHKYSHLPGQYPVSSNNQNTHKPKSSERRRQIDMTNYPNTSIPERQIAHQKQKTKRYISKCQGRSAIGSTRSGKSNIESNTSKDTEVINHEQSELTGTSCRNSCDSDENPGKQNDTQNPKSNMKLANKENQRYEISRIYLTQNVNGLGENQDKIYSWMKSWKKKLLKSPIEVIFLQETHVKTEQQAKRYTALWHKIWGFKTSLPEQYAYWSQASSSKAGVAILINPYTNLANIKMYQEELHSDRLMMIHTSGGIFINIYVTDKLTIPLLFSKAY